MLNVAEQESMWQVFW